MCMKNEISINFIYRNESDLRFFQLKIFLTSSVVKTSIARSNSKKEQNDFGSNIKTRLS
jgi:hypothetical protein